MYLFLGGNSLGDEGLTAPVAPPLPADALPPPTGVLAKLELLYLDGAQITDAGCATLAAAIGSGALPALESIDFGGIPASAAAVTAANEAVAKSRGTVPS